MTRCACHLTRSSLLYVRDEHRVRTLPGSTLDGPTYASVRVREYAYRVSGWVEANISVKSCICVPFVPSMQYRYSLSGRVRNSDPMFNSVLRLDARANVELESLEKD